MHVKNGFTLIEVMIAAGLITVVSALGLVAMQSSSKAIELNQALRTIQQDARSAMMMITREAEFAVKQAPTGLSLPVGVVGAKTSTDNRSFTYQIPINEDFTAFSPPITLTFNEATRQVIRIQSGEEKTVGPANSVTQARFELRDNNTILRITLRTEEPIESLEDRTAQFNLQSDVFLMN